MDATPASVVGRVPPIPSLSIAEAFSGHRGVQQAALEQLAAGFFGRQTALGELSEARKSAAHAI